jgi:hypothetical protein
MMIREEERESNDEDVPCCCWKSERNAKRKRSAMA